MAATKVRTKRPSATTYKGELDGKEFELGRVTKVMEKVTGDAKGGMSYWGAQLALQWVAAENGLLIDPRTWEDIYVDFKKSPFDPNKTKTARGKEGTAAHKLFEQLLLGEATLSPADGMVVGSDGLGFAPAAYDLGVVNAYKDIFQHLDSDEIESERKVRWFEPGHPADCPDEVCTHGYAGTTDYVIPGMKVGGDLKTHKGDARFTDFLQNAFYAKAIKQETGLEMERFMVLIARPDGTYDDYYGFVPEAAVDACYALWRVMEGQWLHSHESSA